MYLFYTLIAAMEFVISAGMFYLFNQTGSSTTLAFAVFAFGIGILASCLCLSSPYNRYS